jgi:hypothetical protein
MPQKISLYEYLHESGQTLTSQDKLMIAKYEYISYDLLIAK